MQKRRYPLYMQSNSWCWQKEKPFWPIDHKHTQQAFWFGWRSTQGPSIYFGTKYLFWSTDLLWIDRLSVQRNLTTCKNATVTIKGMSKYYILVTFDVKTCFTKLVEFYVLDLYSVHMCSVNASNVVFPLKHPCSFSVGTTFLASEL